MNENNPQNSKPKKRPTKKPRVKDDKDPVRRYHFYNSWKKQVNETYIHDLIGELIKWAHKDDSRIIAKFYLEQGITEPLFHDWYNRYPQLKEAYEYAKNVIGVRREEGALDKKYDPKFIQYSLHHYSKDWRKMDKYHDERAARRNNKDNDSNVTINVVRGDFTEEEDVIPLHKEHLCEEEH